MNPFLKSLLISTSLGCTCLGNMQATAQVQVGSATLSKGPGKISAEEMDKFKQSTTYFVLQERDYEQQAEFEQAIAKVWTITPFKIIKPEEMDNLNKAKSSFFFFGGFVTVRQKQGAIVNYHPHLSYDLFMLSTNKKGKTEQNLLGKIMLHLDSKSMITVLRYASLNNKSFGEKVTPYLYQEATMPNWTPLILSGYLKVINDGLTTGTLRSMFDEYTDKDGLKALRDQTLYIPDYVTTKFNMFTGAEKETDSEEGEDNAAYTFGNKYLAAHKIESVAAAQNKPYAYLSYIKSSSDKFVSIFDGATGKLLYTAYTPMSYNFKSKDLKRIAAKVK